MLTRRSDTSARFTRQDVPRVAIAAGILILALTAVLGADILPEAPLDATVGQLATRDIVAPRAVDFVSKVQTDAARLAAMNAVAAAVHLHLRERDPDRRRPAGRVQGAGVADRHDVLGRPQRRGSRVAPEDRRPRPVGQRARDAGRARRRPLGRGQDRGGTDPRRDTAHAAARLGGRRAAQSAVRADGGRPRRGRADARRGTDQSAGRPELHVQLRADERGQGESRRRGRAGPGHDPAGRGHRSQRVAADGDRHREDRCPQPPSAAPGCGQLRWLAPARGPGGRRSCCPGSGVSGRVSGIATTC